jgi:hypothetical protein
VQPASTAAPLNPINQHEARNAEATILTVLLRRRLSVVHFLSRSLSFRPQAPNDCSRGAKLPRPRRNLILKRGAQSQKLAPNKRRFGRPVASTHTTP